MLRLHLSMTVPMEIAKLQANPRMLYAIHLNHDQYTHDLGFYGDVLLFGSKEQKGKPARAFVDLVQMLAALAFQEGGVDFAGLHFEAKEPKQDGSNASH